VGVARVEGSAPAELRGVEPERVFSIGDGDRWPKEESDLLRGHFKNDEARLPHSQSQDSTNRSDLS
jgi:hypothetical protein